MIGDDRIPVVCNSDQHDATVFLANFTGGTLQTRSRTCRSGDDEHPDNRTVRCPLCRQSIAMRGETVRAVDTMIRERPELLTATFHIDRGSGGRSVLPALSATVLHGLALRARKMVDA